MVEIALLAILVLVLLLTLGVPLPYCFGGALMVMTIIGGTTMKGMILWGMGQLVNPILLALPLFVLAGGIMASSGIAASLLRLVDWFIGHIRGGLGVVATLTCALIDAISGSGLTGVAAIGPLLIPEMEAKGYPRAYATALVASSSILGLLILINLMLFVVGMIVNDVTAILLLAPLLMPLMKAIGVTPIQFAALMGVNTAMGGITPPYASILYFAARIGDVKVTQVIPPAMILILFGYVPIVFLTSFWPDLSLWIPRLFGYHF